MESQNIQRQVQVSQENLTAKVQALITEALKNITDTTSKTVENNRKELQRVTIF